MSRQAGNGRCKKRSRSTLKFEPEFDGPIAGWAVNYIKQNLWRFTPFLDFDDLYQEAYVKFRYVADKYPEVVEPQHFMSLFKISLVNHFHSLSWKRMEERKVIVHECDYDNDAEDCYSKMARAMKDPISEVAMIFNVVVNEAPKEMQELLLSVLANEAPKEIRKPLSIMMNKKVKKNFIKRHPKGSFRGGRFASENSVRWNRVAEHQKGLRTRETTNDLLCRLAKCDSETANLVLRFSKHFG